MKKGKVKVYQLNSDGKYVQDEQIYDYAEKASEDRVECFTGEVKDNTDGLPKEVYKSLHTNPFLFVINETNRNHVLSLEDFYVTYKQMDENLGGILRSNKYSKRKKKKIFKKQFKIWENDANKEAKDAFTNIENSIAVAKEQNFVSLGFFGKFSLILAILIVVFLNLNIVPWLTITVPTIKYISFGVIAIAILGIFLAILQDIKIKKFKNYISKQKQLYKKYLKEVNKGLKKRVKKVYKYYSKALSKKKFVKAPIPVEKILIGGEKIDYIKNQNEILTQKCMDILKRNNKFNGLYSFPLLCAFLTGITSVGYLIYLCILKLIDILK